MLTHTSEKYLLASVKTGVHLQAIMIYMTWQGGRTHIIYGWQPILFFNLLLGKICTCHLITFIKSWTQRFLSLVDNIEPYSMKGSWLESTDKTIKCLFSPPKTTSVLQTLDQRIIIIIKKFYHRNILRAIVSKDDSANKGLSQIIKSFTMKDALFMIADSWDIIKPLTES